MPNSFAANFGAPYRAPCGGWPAQRKVVTGGCYQHRRAADVVQKYDNTTRVYDYRNDPPSGAIPPYWRRHQGTVCGDSDATCDTPNNKPCGPWGYPTQPDQYVAGVEATGWNALSAAVGEVIDNSTCRKLGFKIVQGWKVWHGRHGYLSRDHYNPSHVLNGEGCGACEWTPELPSADQTKYLTSEYHSEIARTWPEDAYNAYYSNHGTSAAAGEAYITRSIAQTAGGVPYGVLVVDDCYDGSDPFVAEDNACWDRLWTYNNINFTWSHGVYQGYIDKYSTSEYELTVTETSTTRTFTATTTPNSGYCLNGPYVAAEGSINLATGELSIKEYDCELTQPDPPDDDVWEWLKVYELTATFTNTGFTITIWQNWFRGNELGHYEETITITGALSNAYTAADVRGHVNTLLDEWPLNDDALYPWRMDEFCTIAPVVHYNELASVRSPDEVVDCDYEDESAEVYDGRILGAPLAAGVYSAFSYGHKTWRWCNGTSAGFVYSYGAWSANMLPVATESNGWPTYTGTGDGTDAVVPRCATEWTENSDDGTWHAGSYPRTGAWQIFDDNKLIAQKWAEIKVPHFAVNFGRPCGQDRYAMKSSNYACAWEDGSQVATSAALAYTAGTTKFRIKIGSAYDGIYTISSGSNPYTVAKVGDTPVGMPAEAETNGYIGELRWPNAPGICGRAGVSTAVQADTVVNITTASAVYLRVGDYVDFSSVGSLGSNVQVESVTSTTQFAVIGTVGTYAGGGYVAAHGAPAYYWFDQDSKGDYHLVEWRFDFRDWVERDRVIDQYTNYCGGASCTYPWAIPPSLTAIRASQTHGGTYSRDVTAFNVTTACLPFDACNPQVICISPNGEEWANGATTGFYALALDSVKGSRWQQVVVQEIEDPLWQAPPPPCGAVGDGTFQPSGCAWTEDDGSCHCTWTDADGVLSGSCDNNTCVAGIGTLYYPHARMVEGLAANPSGAPTNYINLGYATLAEWSSASPSKPIFPPPEGPGFDTSDAYMQPFTPETPWGTYWRMIHCYCLDGQFKADYTEYGAQVSCPS